MKIKVEVSRVSINIPKHVDKLRSNRLWLYTAQQWHRLYHKFVPFDTGALADTVIITPGQVEHISPYARYVYYGSNFRFRRDKHPLASREWDKAAAPSQLPKLQKTVQAYIDSGRLNLNG